MLRFWSREVDDFDPIPSNGGQRFIQDGMLGGEVCVRAEHVGFLKYMHNS